MTRKMAGLVVVLVLALAVAVPAYADPGKPNFGPALFGDGRVWGTKSVTVLPTPNENSLQSFEKLFTFTNGSSGQLSVAEAAPGNPNYNGGRWYTQTVTWTQAGLDAYGSVPPVLKSYDEILFQVNLGYLTVTAGPPAGGPPPYFLCPLLPVK